MVVRQTSPKGWQLKLAKVCGVVDDSLNETLIAEHIRAAIYSPLAQFGTTGVFPVHTQRINAALSRNLRPWITDASASASLPEATLRKSLAEIGDIYDAGEGLWLPAPTRLIESSDVDHLILISGKPSSLLEREVRSALSCFHGSRFVPRTIAKLIPTEIESIHEWLGGDADVGRWIRRQNENLVREMRGDGDLEIDGIEIYAPDLRKHARLSGAWSRPADHHWDGSLRQFRTLTPPTLVHTRQYYVGSFRTIDTASRLVKSARIDRDFAARYRFAVDLEKKMNRTLYVKRSGPICAVSIKFYLPQPERKLLALSTESDKDPYERIFANHAIPFLAEALGRLGISLGEKK